MDKIYIVEQLKKLAAQHNVEFEEQVLNEIVSGSQFKVAAKGEILQGIGESTRISGLVVSGITRSYYIDNAGNDITRGFGVEGTFCMDAGMLGFTESVCMCEALEESTIMLFETGKMKKMIESSDSLKLIWIKLLEDALRYKLYRENGFLVESATERYLNFRKSHSDIARRVSQQYIATYLGITPESLSRIRRSLKEPASEYAKAD